MDSRIEQLLDALLNGTDSNVIPQSRVEQYLHSIIKGETDVDEPRSRVEAYLYKICKDGLSTGNGTGHTKISQTAYDALVTAGTVDPETVYDVYTEVR